MQVTKAQNFRYNLRALCDHRALRQRVLAEMAGVSAVHVNRVLQGHSDPSLDMCERLADAVGVSFEDLVGSPQKFSEDHLTFVNT